MVILPRIFAMKNDKNVDFADDLPWIYRQKRGFYHQD
jgi:hypothetical protein